MYLFRNKYDNLPKGTGPFVPGCYEVMLDYDQRGIFMRMYYPTNHIDDDKINSKRWIPWIPNKSYLVGIANVVMVFFFIIRFLFWWNMKKIPVIFGAKPKTDQKMKCVIISHGLGAARFICSNVCYELASRGYLVIAMEHRDGSACHTYYYDSEINAKNNKQQYIKFQKIALGKEHFSRRNQQVHYRAEECCKALDFLIRLNKGDVPHNVLSDIGQKVEVNLEDFQDKLDLTKVAIGGHSFGAATALLAMSKRDEFQLGVLMDPWMFPIKNENLEQNIKSPLIFINTQTFHIESNVTAMSKFLTNDQRKMYTILHTTHESQTDSPLLVGYWLNWFMKKLKPGQALKINNALILDFLDQYSKCPSSVSDCRKVLEEERENIEEGLTRPWGV